MPRITNEQMNRLENFERKRRFPDVLGLRTQVVYRISDALGWIQRRLLESVKEPCWRKGDGRIIRISDMSDNHLFNAYDLVRRRNDDPLMEAQLNREISKRVSRRHKM